MPLYTLVLFLAGAVDGGVASLQVRDLSADDCNAAAAEYRRQAAKLQLGLATGRPAIAMCVRQQGRAL